MLPCVVQMDDGEMKTLVIAIAALTIAACTRGQDSYGYVPPAKLTPDLDQCLTAQGETKRCDQAGPARLGDVNATQATIR